MQERQTLRSNMPPRQQSGWRGRRLGILAAVLVLILLVGSATIVFRALRQGSTGPNVGAQPTATSSLPPTATPIPFQVTGIAMSVSPSSLAGLTCGTHLTVQYKAVFHVAPQSQGGTVQFSYTVNNGRSQTPASLTFQPGESTKSYTFSWSGALPADHTYPGQGGVAVTSPNQVISPTVAPRGSCVAQSAFTVLGVQMAVSPASLAGRACGTALSVTYTATFHVAANSPGGTIQFEYTVNNGRSSAAASLKFVPGETSKSYTFTWSGNLPVDHTYPEQGGVIVTSPNAVNSSLLGPTGQCS